MYLKSITGKIIFEGRFSSVKRGAELAVEAGVCLDEIDLRHANLSGAELDNAKMKGACFWGANLNGVNLSGAHLQHCDFRTTHLPDSCLADSDCSESDFSGAYFSRTIFRKADLSQTRFSCPSIFSVDLTDTQSLKGAIYSHMGELDCDFSHAPLIIQGLRKPIIFMDDAMLVGNQVKKIALREPLMQEIITFVSSKKIFE